MKVRTRLQNILKVAETESGDNERETNHTQGTGRCCLGGCIGGTRGHQARPACQRHSSLLVPAKSVGGFGVPIMMTGGSTEQTKLIFSAIKNYQISKI